MRKLKRSIARSVMQAQGIERINKPRVGADGKMSDKSYFAEHWRDYVGAVAARKPRKAKGRKRRIFAGPARIVEGKRV